MKKGIFIFLVAILFIPQLEKYFMLFPLNPLHGVTLSDEKAKFNLKNWFSGKYQMDFEKTIDENYGFRNFFIRLFNQLDYFVFRKTNNPTIIVGKDNYLYQNDYIDEMIAKNFFGPNAMRSSVANIRRVQDHLDNKNIFMLTVLAPAKTYYYPEFLPDYFLKRLADTTSYTTITDYAAQAKIRMIDLNQWFMQLKDTSNYPLFSKQGIHWNYYGMALSTDTIVKYIEQTKKIKLPNISWTLKFPDDLRGTDYDLGDLLNIFDKLPYNKMPYPEFNIENDSTIKKPSLLVIGDSFYWSIFNEQVFNRVFKNETFYYYCSAVHPGHLALSKSPYDLNILKEVEKYDIIILLQSSANYSNPGVNFIPLMISELNRYDEYRSKEKNIIMESDSLKNYVNNLAIEKNVSFDSAVIFLSDSLTSVYFQKISDQKILMRTNTNWIEQMKDKADLLNVSLEHVMQADAEWMLKREK